RGAIWLAGRSSHGHQLARLDVDGRWSARHSLCVANWGGRGRRMALVQRDGEVWLGRRAPDGIDVRPCPDPGAPPSPVAAAPPPEVEPTPASPPAPRTRTRPPTILFGDLHQHTA